MVRSGATIEPLPSGGTQLMIQIRTAANREWYRRWGKRTLDVALSSLALFVLWPVISLIATVVRFIDGSPVLFVQLRPGLNERIHAMLKFRTMTDARNPNGELLPDELRITWLGKLLRATSLDELPELWSVLRGEMSLVGPRPLLVEYLPYYSDEQRRRHSVRPGMTGLAQVSGRNHTTWEQRLAQDISYADNYSLWLDCKIIAQTVLVIFHGDGGVKASSKLGRFRGCVAPNQAQRDVREVSGTQ
jgi:undecaprenyl phosphate N,N'-diacetylbacillosamine 1-phosphate transferase